MADRGTSIRPEAIKAGHDRNNRPLIALLVDNKGNRHQLSAQLRRHFEVISPEDDGWNTEAFDLAIVDGRGIKRWASELDAVKANTHPVFLPTILIMPRLDVRRISATSASLIDDFTIIPINIDECLQRIDMLLRAREKSLRQHEDLTYAVNHDTATGLPTQELFVDRISSAVERAEADSDTLHVIAVHIPLAHLMRSLGPGALTEIAQKCVHVVQQALPENIFMARLGTEQGALLPPPGLTTETVTELVRQTAEAVHRPMVVQGEEIRLTAYFGVASYPDDATDAKELLTAALSALECAEKPDLAYFFSGEIQEQSLKYLRIESGLHRALSGDEFELWYQPQFRLSDLELVGAEALIRWRLPSGELVSPAEFIPVAEKSNLIRKISSWVIDSACRTLREWQADQVPCPRIAVNLTPEDLMAGDFLARICELLADHQLEAGALEIELTESMLLNVDESVLERLTQIREFGMRVAIDDFGTGYSSLGYLHRLPADVLKIDKSFTDRVPGDPSGEAITGAIIGLAKQFGLELVAEGIETREQLAYLDKLGVNSGQGFLVARPLPADEFVDWVSQGLAARDL